MSIQVNRITPFIGIVTINNPQSLNVLNSETIRELKITIEALEEDARLRVIIITGGGKAFVAGADISEMNEMSAEEARNYAMLGARLFQRIETINKVTIAAINGYALGGGCELAMACDVRIASESAKFGQPEVGLGIIPGFSGIRRMIDIVGEARAKEFIFSGRMFDAQTAEKIGLVNRVVSPESLMENCIQVAEEISNKSFHAILMSKKVINAIKGDLDERIRYQSDCFAKCFDHRDQIMGMTAFLNKVKPTF